MLLEPVYEVRNDSVFRDCVVLLAGHCQSVDTTPSNFGVSDHLSPVIEKAIHGIENRLARAQKGVFEVMKIYHKHRAAINSVIINTSDHLPEYYRKIGDIIEKGNVPGTLGVLDEIRSLLQINLSFCDKNSLRPVSSETNFFCAEVLHKDLPWDPTQTDW